MNASPSPPAGSPHSWLAHAKSDLRITQICRSDSGVLPNQTVFHAQQAAEKAIKAVLLEHKIRFPRTHDLGELIVLIQQHAVIWPFARANRQFVLCKTRGYIARHETTQTKGLQWEMRFDLKLGKAHFQKASLFLVALPSHFLATPERMWARGIFNTGTASGFKA
jgi:HEPN domain